MDTIRRLIRDIIGPTRPRDLPGRLLAYALLWWLITGGDATAWTWGLPAIVAAALISPLPPGTAWRISPLAALRFVPAFLLFSVRSASDVALRAAHPQRPLHPALLDYPWTLPPEGGRIFLANLINLMPGTLCVRISDTAMTVHTIGDTDRTLTGIHELEALTAALFKVPLEAGQPNE